LGKLFFGSDLKVSSAPFPVESIFGLLALGRIIWSQWPLPKFNSSLVKALLLFGFADLWLLMREANWELIWYPPFYGLWVRFAAFCLLCYVAMRKGGPRGALFFFGAVGFACGMQAIEYIINFGKNVNIAGTVSAAQANMMEVQFARASSMQGDPNVLALFWALAASAVGYLAFASRVWRIPAFAGFMVLLVGIVQSASRTGLLTLGGSCVAWLVIERRHRIKGILAITVLFAFLWLLSGTGFRDRILANDSIEKSRTYVWENGLQCILRSPWVGSGYRYYENSEIPEGAHNSLMDAMAKGGVVYLVPYLVCLFVLCQIGQSSTAKNLPFRKFYVTGLCGYLIGIQGLNFVMLSGGGSSFMIFGAAFAMIGLQEGDTDGFGSAKKHLKTRASGLPAWKGKNMAAKQTQT